MHMQGKSGHEGVGVPVFVSMTNYNSSVHNCVNWSELIRSTFHHELTYKPKKAYFKMSLSVVPTSSHISIHTKGHSVCQRCLKKCRGSCKKLKAVSIVVMFSIALHSVEPLDWQTASLQERSQQCTGSVCWGSDPWGHSYWSCSKEDISSMYNFLAEKLFSVHCQWN